MTDDYVRSLLAFALPVVLAHLQLEFLELPASRLDAGRVHSRILSPRRPGTDGAVDRGAKSVDPRLRHVVVLLIPNHLGRYRKLPRVIERPAAAIRRS